MEEEFNFNSMTKNLSKVIEREINKSKKEYGDEWYLKYFNNFYGNLPGGLYRDPLLFPRHIRDKKIIDFEEPNDKLSRIRLNQSTLEFHKTIDDVIKELRLNPREITEAQEKYKKHYDLELFDLIIPIYIRLREMGYKHYPDLTA